jgi:hypothetical protein
MDAASPPNQPPMLTLCSCGMNESWEPIEWHRETSPIAEVDAQRIVCDCNRFCCRGGHFDWQGIRAKPHVRWQNYDSSPGSLRMLNQYRVCLSSPVFRSAPSSTRLCKSLVAVALEVLVILR